MKKYSKIITVLLFLLIVFFLFIKPNFDSKKASLAVEVVSIFKMKRSGDYKITLEEKGKTKYIYYTFFDNRFEIEIGDSIFKESNSSKLFIKEKSGIVRLADDQDVLITY